MISDPAAVADAYRHCTALARSHYENFPVASRLLPRKLREPVAAIYAFARHADDLADEGQLDQDERTTALQAYRHRLQLAAEGRPQADDPVFIALADAIARHALPSEQLDALLDAFLQDVHKRRYADFGEVMNYCRRSANPVGRLLLQLGGQATPENLARSDAVCSALQLINFYQDLHEDYAQRGRLYLPLDELQRFGVAPDDIGARRNSPGLYRLMQHQYARADRLLRSGAPLGSRLPGRMGLEVRAIIVGGARILYRLRRQSDDVFTRPRLNLADRMAILRGAFGRAGGA
ncbi:MAG: squalene synthase HpnC [Acidihalobacter sp.]|uniref:squalene synthase HpnC n=1 Tax=Acidihalobacter sp. TaxID=1872108 RepID=UPI00307E2E6B